MNNGIILGLRLLAFIIDISIGLGLVTLSFQILSYLSGNTGNQITVLFSLMFVPIIFTLPIIYMGVTTGLFSKTLGKWVCRLEVVDKNNRELGIWRSLGRESVKVLITISSIGLIIYIIQVAINGKLFHDYICHTEVNFIGGLTETQKNWRKYHRKNSTEHP